MQPAVLPGEPHAASAGWLQWPGLARLRLPILATSWLAGALALAPSLYMLEVYGRVLNARSTTTLWMLSLLVVFAFAVMEALDWLRSRLLHHASERLTAQMGPRLFRSALAARVLQQPGGDTSALQDWKTVRRFLHSTAVHGVLDAPVSLLFLAAVFLISPWLGLFAMVGAAVQVALALGLERATAPRLRQANQDQRAAVSLAEETVRNAEVLASMGMAQRMQARWMERQKTALLQQAGASEQASTLSAFSRLGQNVIASGLLGLACALLLFDNLNGGPAMVIVASILGGRVLAPLLLVIAQWSSVVGARQAWERLRPWLGEEPAAALPLPAPQGQLAVEGLVASIPGRRGGPPVLKGLSFKVARGQVLAVVGPSAAGKSTLARLLVGLWPAAQGAVRLDGFELHGWSRDEVGRHIGYLPQDVQLLPGTIAENLCRFEDPVRESAQDAARRVGLHDTVEALAQGYETPLDDASRLLSGGQRQRLAIACALYGRPALVVLDEPNASLDEAGEDDLVRAICQMKAAGTTFLVITHRTRLLEAADAMLVLVDGQAQAFGPRDEVLAALRSRPQPPAGARA